MPQVQLLRVVSETGTVSERRRLDAKADDDKPEPSPEPDPEFLRSPVEEMDAAEDAEQGLAIRAKKPRKRVRRSK